MTPVEEIIALAAEGSPYEVCGLMAASGKKCRLIPAKNMYERPREGFVLDPDCWLDVAEGEEVIGIYHSHPVTSAEPSMHDLVMCEATNLPWHIVNPQTFDHRMINPTGYLAPYERRPYVHGVLDCYSVVRDWYAREWALGLPDYPRKDGWWNAGQNLYLDYFPECGFIVQPEGTAFEVGDLAIIQHGGKVPNHAALYVGNGNILHHVYGRLSRIDVYGGVWSRQTTHHLRHESKVKQNG